MTTPKGTLPLLLDSTMLVQFRACPRKFFWEYVLNLRPAGRERDLVAGAAFAAGLEAAYLAHFLEGLDDNKAIERAFVAFSTSWSDFPHSDPESWPAKKQSPKTFNRMFQAIIYYLDAYPFDKDYVQPMALSHKDGAPSFEFSFAIPLPEAEGFPLHPSGTPFLYAGRLDALGHYNNKLVIRDEKTTKNYFSDRWSDQWTFRNQFIGYCWAMTRSGYPTDTAVIRGIQVLKTGFKHLEAIKIYPRHVFARFEEQLRRDLHRMVSCYDTAYFDYDIGEACMSYKRPCQFLDLCTSSEPSLWFGDFERKRWNPLTRTVEEVDG